MGEFGAFIFRLLTILEGGGYIAGFVGLIVGVSSKDGGALAGLGVGLMGVTFVVRVLLNFLFNLPQWWDIHE